jgi:hypothetical protein
VGNQASDGRSTIEFKMGIARNDNCFFVTHVFETSAKGSSSKVLRKSFWRSLPNCGAVALAKDFFHDPVVTIRVFEALLSSVERMAKDNKS